MPFTFIRSPLVASALLVLVTPGRPFAQEVAASAVALSARHLLADAPLFGGAVAGRWSAAGGGVTYHIGGEWMRGSDDRLGVPCAGLIEPGTCAPEQVRNDARLHGADAGVAIRVLGGGRAALALTADVTLASVRRDSRGRSSGRTLAAEKSLWGGRMGVQARCEPWMNVPLAVELGASAGRLTPFTTEVLVDGYTPFDDGFRTARLTFGLSWRFVQSGRQGLILPYER